MTTFLFCCLMLFAPMQATGTASRVPASVVRYAGDITAYTNGHASASLETIFEEGITAAKEIEPKLEQFDQATYEKLQKMMAGFVVTREEFVAVRPLADFFLKLAREKGADADWMFFELFKKTYPDSIWPVYVNRLTDITGCTSFVGNRLSDLYGAWTTFQARYPHQYRRASRRELARLQEALQSDCPCDPESVVRSALQSFLNEHPHSPPAPAVAARIAALTNHESGIRFKCKGE